MPTFPFRRSVGQDLRDQFTHDRLQERANDIGYTSIEEGALEVRSQEGLIVQGSAKITGVLDGDGTLHWSGQVELVGPVQIVGDVTRTGTETATGTTTLNGTTNINGPTTVQGDLDVTGGGTIQAGAVTITPAAGGQVQIGSFTFSANGSMTDTNPAGVRVETTLSADRIISGSTLDIGNVAPDPGGTVSLRWDPITKRVYRGA